MRQRFEIAHIYCDFIAMIQTHFSKKIKAFRSDGAREYLSSKFRDILLSQDTLPQ